MPPEHGIPRRETGASRLIWLFPLALAMVHDAVARRRVERVYIVGLAIMLVAFARVGLMESEAWLTIGRRLLGILMPS